MKIVKVTSKKIKRKLSYDEIKYYKSNKVVKDFRQLAKSVNFGFIFGLNGKTFAKNFLKLYWTEKEVDEYLLFNKLQNNVKNFLESNKKYSELDAKYIVVADDIRSKYFKLYKGFQQRIKRNIEIGEKLGFIQSVNGSIRRVHLLKLMGKDNSFYDRQSYYNILANTTIQNDEACKVMNCISKLMEKWKKDHKYEKGYVFASIHDSIDIYVKKDYLKEIIQDIKDIVLSKEDWQKDISLPIDLQVVDLNKNQYYKHGETYDLSK